MSAINTVRELLNTLISLHAISEYAHEINARNLKSNMPDPAKLHSVIA